MRGCDWGLETVADYQGLGRHSDSMGLGFRDRLCSRIDELGGFVAT